jgi:hypothetical protein
VVCIQRAQFNQQCGNRTFSRAGCAAGGLERYAQFLFWQDCDEVPFRPGFQGNLTVHCAH